MKSAAEIARELVDALPVLSPYQDTEVQCDYRDLIEVITAAITQERERAEKLVKALEYYSDPQQWKIGYYGLENNPAPAIWTRDGDEGKRARQALEEWNGGE